MFTSKPITLEVKKMKNRSRPGNHETLLMTLAMLDMIPKIGKISAGEMHVRLFALGYERDLRSIQRQMEVLSTQFAIERDESSKPYGYKWRQNAKGISIPGLTLHESLLLNMAEKYLRNLLPSSLKQAMDGFFNQARFNLSNAVDKKLERRWMDKVRLVSPSVSLYPPEIKIGVLETVSQALFHETWLELEYTNAGGEHKKHRVMPLGLAQQGARLVLVVRFEGYVNERNLALSRILEAIDTRLPFPAVENFDLAKYDERGGFGYGHGRTIHLKFRIEKQIGMFLTESRLGQDQTVSEQGDKLEITVTVAQSQHLVWWLRGFGQQVEVLSPVALANEVAA